MIKIYTLNNGIRVVINKIEGVYSASFGVFVGAGSANERIKENGISHFIEHVTFKGTKKRNSFDISNDIELIGADINAYTTRNLTCYYVKSTAYHTKEALEILSDVFLNSVYDEDELEKEKNVILQEINMCEDTPDDLCADLLNEAYFGKTGYGARILGDKKRVKSFKRTDVLNYKQKYYTTDNIVISVSGGIDEGEVLKLVDEYFGCVEKSKCAEKPVYNTENLAQSLSKSKNITQTHICLGFKAVGILSDDADAFNIATYVLGGGMSSRLFQTVREKLGLCYSVYSFMSAYTDCGYSMIYAGVDPKKASDAYDAVILETDKFKREGITDEEFKRSSEQMKSSLVFAQESVSSQMQLHGKRLLLTGECLDFDERFSKLEKITKDDVNGLIDRLFDIKTLAKSIVGKGVKPL